jgi:hypothetical protein
MSAPPPIGVTPPAVPPVPNNAPLPNGTERGVVGKLYNSVKGFFGQGGRMTKRMMRKMSMKKKMMKKKMMMKKKKMLMKKKKMTMKKKMMKKKLKAKTRKSRR